MATYLDNNATIYDDSTIEPGDLIVLFAGLNENTSYKVKIEGNDSDGNIVTSNTLDVTTSDNPNN